MNFKWNHRMANYSWFMCEIRCRCNSMNELRNFAMRTMASSDVKDIKCTLRYGLFSGAIFAFMGPLTRLCSIFFSFWLLPSNDQVNAVKTYEHLINGQCDGNIANVPSQTPTPWPSSTPSYSSSLPFHRLGNCFPLSDVLQQRIPECWHI